MALEVCKVEEKVRKEERKNDHNMKLSRLLHIKPLF